jgi:CRP/FNR family transcriptional regulator
MGYMHDAPHSESSHQQVKVPLTHQEIAEFLSTTRETVTRTLSEFKTRNLVTLQGSTLTISNRAALESISGM